MSKRTKVDIVRELPASAIRWELEPLPREEYDSYLDMVVDVTIESLSYRTLLLAALERLAAAEKRERHRRDVHR